MSRRPWRPRRPAPIPPAQDRLGAPPAAPPTDGATAVLPSLADAGRPGGIGPYGPHLSPPSPPVATPPADGPTEVLPGFGRPPVEPRAAGRGRRHL
ncbi:MAG: hypothetical protein LBG60_15100, partial [Bifidobacteriaceae bacterium]|nr:hypothetical protein [Bifidobacteriaceae bacterium]